MEDCKEWIGCSESIGRINPNCNRFLTRSSQDLGSCAVTLVFEAEQSIGTSRVYKLHEFNSIALHSYSGHNTISISHSVLPY